MAEAEVQSNLDHANTQAADTAQQAADTAAQAGHEGVNAGAQAAQAGIEAERRTFGAATDAGRQSAEAMGRAAQTSLKAGQDIARHGQDLARRAGDQATEFWRTSLTPMTQLQGEMNRWFEQIWRQASPARLQGGFPALLASPFAGFPVSDLHQTDEGLELLVELPGLKPENVQLSLRGDVLVLSGEKSATTEKGDGGYRVNERRFGRFERSFVLPPEADRNRIDAAFQDGLLRVSIPKLAEGEESKTIPVHA